MADDRRDSRDPTVIDVGSGGAANSVVDTIIESPAAGNGNNGEHVVDAEEFEGMRMAIGTLGKSILEMSLSDNLPGTRHIDIRVRQNNRPQSGGGVAAVGPVNEAPPQQVPAPPPDNAAAAHSRRLKITVAEDEPEPDADAKYLDKMRGWLMTVATLFVGITFQAAIQPPQWALGARQGRASANALASGPATAPSPVISAAHQQAATNELTSGEYSRANFFYSLNGLAFLVALSLLLVLVLARRGTPAARRAMNLVKYGIPCLCVMVGSTLVVGMCTSWEETAWILALFVLHGTLMTVYML